MVRDNRSKRAKAIDRAKSAPRVREEKWRKNKDEFDLKGHDTPESANRNTPLTNELSVRGRKLVGRLGSETVVREEKSKKKAKEKGRNILSSREGRGRLNIKGEDKEETKNAFTYNDKDLI